MLAPSYSEGTVPVCDVLVHGSGECEQLGLGDGVLERKKPTVVKALLGEQVVDIAVGSLHNLALTATGQVYSWGCNDEGALGRFGEENVPTLIPAFVSTPIRAIAVGDCHSAFIDVAGRLWLCGTYKDSSGHLGFPDYAKGIGHVHHKATEPVLVQGLPPRSQVDSVSCGANHTVVLLSIKSRTSGARLSAGPTTHRVMTWGNDEFGQLGLGREDEEGRPEEDTVMLKHTRRGKRHQKAKLFPRDCLVPKNITNIWTGAQTSFVKTGSGEILCCGLNNFGQLGLGSTSPYPVRLFAPNDVLSAFDTAWIGGGTVHGAARTEDGKVITWGRRDYSGLAEKGTNDIQAPSVLPGLPDVARVSCGGSHTLASSKTGKVYAWGFGGTHQLGNLPRDVSNGAAGEDEMPGDEQTPYLVDSKQLASRFVIAVGAGAQHSVELAWSGEYSERDLSAQLDELVISGRSTPRRKRPRMSEI